MPLRQTGGDGGPNHWTSEAATETDLRAQELETHFGSQFQGAGWSRLDAGADGPLAWSRWKKTGDRGDVHALLFVLEGLAPRQRTLFARATTGPGIGGSVYMSSTLMPR
ncbi:MAG: hypothetical protein GEU73_10645 [Chloroflexi bacterium]|nr:hypothetical protein [Chloroflexota bacterium]